MLMHDLFAYKLLRSFELPLTSTIVPCLCPWTPLGSSPVSIIGLSSARSQARPVFHFFRHLRSLYQFGFIYTFHQIKLLIVSK